MSDPKILVHPPRDTRGRAQLPDVAQAWKWVGWFGLVLAIAGIGDWVLAWYPLSFGTVEWEFGTVVSSISNLPLVSMGFAGMLGSAVARGIRWQVVLVACALLVWAVLLLGALTIFALDIPVALAAVQRGVARMGILKAIAKTLFLGTLFAVAYVVAAIGALRRRPQAG